ncbi:hypothetical protein Salat_0840700 [Sesamum alatum]|uniref:Uncharacterized protein n=1 Tax=Sesamum alatum TaxID=300844 RepID=A0AAE2CQH3_9LAMI|nr:hypothetical protein Salat_0840700 [Sesamum alatum]
MAGIGIPAEDILVAFGEASNTIQHVQIGKYVDAYVQKGEPEWDKLKMIFEPNEEPPVVKVVDISSGEEENIGGEEAVREEDVINISSGSDSYGWLFESDTDDEAHEETATLLRIVVPLTSSDSE